VKHFWHGFHDKKAAARPLKTHGLLLFWSPDSPASQELKKAAKKLSRRYPSVKLRLVNSLKDPAKAKSHKVNVLPTALLLAHGREVDRVDRASGMTTLLEVLFRRAAAT